jgi:hypothetical protein
MQQHGFLLAGLVFGIVGLPLACSSDDASPSQNDNLDPMAQAGSASANAGTSAGGASTGGTSQGGSNATGGNSTAGMGTGGSGGAGAMDWIAGDGLGIEDLVGAFAFSDGVSTWAISAPVSGQVCLAGQGALAGATYANWGAGLGLQFSATNAMGAVEMPFDAAARGIAGYSFTITGVPTTGVRPGVAQVDATGLAFQENAFVNGVDAAGDIKADGTVTIYFADLQQPSWTGLPAGDSDAGGGYAFDATQLHAVQWQVVTNQAIVVDYDFCISDFTWVDADGNPISGGAIETDAGAPEQDAG